MVHMYKNRKEGWILLGTREIFPAQFQITYFTKEVLWMKKSGGKLLGILLTASILATAVFPMQGTAAEEIDRGMEQEAQMEEEDVTPEETTETTISADIPQTAEMDDSLIMPLSYDINQPVIESFELVENGQTLSRNDTLHFKMSAYDTDRDIRTITVQIRKVNSYYTWNVPFQKSMDTENLYTGTFDCSSLTGYEGDYYVSQIRLEDETNNYVECPVAMNGKNLYTFTFQNTRTLSVSDYQIQTNPSNADGNLRVGDTVTFKAHIECEGMELAYAQVYLETEGYIPGSSEFIYMDYNTETQTLTSTYTIKDSTCPSKWIIYRLLISAGNRSYYFYPYQDNPDKNLSFTVVNDDYDREKPVIKSITIDKNRQMVKAGETVTIKVKVDEVTPNSSMSVRFSPQASGISYLSKTLYLNSSTMEYTGTINITQDSYPTKWELTYLSVSDVSGNTASLSDFREDWNTTRPWYYTVDPQGYLDDRKAPVIESITIDKNGQWVYPGDTVTLTVKVDDENPLSTAEAYFYPQVSYVSSYQRMTLHYNADAREYRGTISITNDTYPCEWMLTNVTVSDAKGHSVYLADFKPDWQDTCPWYYRVETDETYREDVKDAAFSVYGYVRQEDGSYRYDSFVENKTMKVGRRDSLEGLGICPPLPAEGVNVKFREDSSGMEINADTELFFGNSSNPSYDFRAVYDKICVNVLLTYVSKEKGATMAVVPQFVDRDTTYGEMLASFVPPADADLELLAGYQLDDSLDETAQVEEIDYVGVEAKYNNCLVVWNIRYLGENGNEVSKIVSKTYEKNTTINAALAVLEDPIAPDGMEFEKWILPGISGNETVYHEMTNLDVRAVYKGKTTAEVSYTYRGEDGKLISGSRLMALDGENLSYQAAFEEVKKTLKELKHLKGLVLSDWAGIMKGIDIPRYKKMNIQAQYANCVVILKYPKDVYKYVVVEKGSSFTLPVENESYRDILWEGYSKGQTVTITGDKEFLVKDAKRKNGSTQDPSGPSGEKLPMEEIDKIVDVIKQCGSGETIYVDMGKTTVVPKEILEAIKGNEVNIVLDMGGYSWSISGNEVVATHLKDIDLEVIVDTDGIPPAIVDSLAGGKPSTQITLTHNGEFGFRADLTVNLGIEHSGSTGKLYYYDSTGKLIYMDVGEIGADGNITLSFSHASEYVVIFEKASLDSDNETNSSIKVENTISPSLDEKKDDDSGIRKSPKTGDCGVGCDYHVLKIPLKHAACYKEKILEYCNVKVPENYNSKHQ